MDTLGLCYLRRGSFPSLCPQGECPHLTSPLLLFSMGHTSRSIPFIPFIYWSRVYQEQPGSGGKGQGHGEPSGLQRTRNRWILQISIFYSKWSEQQGFGFSDHSTLSDSRALLGAAGIHLTKLEKHHLCQNVANMVRKAFY